MSKNIIQLNGGIIKNELKELVSNSVEGKTPAQKEYATIYNRLKTRKCRGTISSDEWNRTVALALEYKDKAERGEISKFELKRIFAEM